MTLASGLYPPELCAQQPAITSPPYNPSIIRNVSGLSEKVELTTNSSRILTLDMKIPRVQVNNPELVKVTPLSDRELQVFAQKAGVTQINVWDEEGQIHSIDVLIYGDARELEHALQVQFPHSSIRVYRYSESLVLKGFVDQPETVTTIMQMAEDYAPKVINNITVGGAQQVLLKVKVMEVSRTKLRQLGVDWGYLGGDGSYAISSVTGFVRAFASGNNGPDLNIGSDTFAFGIIDGGDSFHGLVRALQQHQIAKILAEPNIVAVSGRPAKFIHGGEFVYLVPQGGVGGGQTVTAQFKEFGTIIDFVPIVLGNGNIRLEVRPEVSTPDESLGVIINDNFVPGLRKRFVETAVEMRAGQTFALAGMIDRRVDTINRGMPYLSDIPVLGVPFRRTVDETNEVELLIMVTPEFVDPMDPHEVPCGGPGMETVSPNNSQLYCGGHVEVPHYCNPIRGPYACGEPGCENCGGGPGMGVAHDGHMIQGDIHLPGGTGYDYSDSFVEPLPAHTEATHGELNLPPAEVVPSAPADHGAGRRGVPGGTMAGDGHSGGPYTSPRPYSPARAPLYLRNPQISNTPRPAAATASLPSMIGPVGYDVEQ